MKLALALLFMLSSMAYSQRPVVPVARPLPVPIARPVPVPVARFRPRPVPIFPIRPVSGPRFVGARPPAVIVRPRPPTVVVVRPPTVIRPGKRDVSKMSMPESISDKVSQRAVVIRPGKRAMLMPEQNVMEERKRAVAVIRRPPTVVVRPGKRDDASSVSDKDSMKKRDESELKVMRIVVSLATGKIEWSYGMQEKIVCDMKERFGNMTGQLTIRLSDLHVLEAFEKSVHFLSLLSAKSSFESQFTFMREGNSEPILWSIFSKDIAGKLGFFIQDEVCFRAIFSAVKEHKTAPVELFLM